jgi:signal transduction histidine kinase
MSIDVIPDLKQDIFLDAENISKELADEFGISPIKVKLIHYDKIKKSIQHHTISSKQDGSIFDIPLNEMGHFESIYYFDKDLYRVSSMLILEKEELKIFIQLAMKKDINSPYLNGIFWVITIATPLAMIVLTLMVNLIIKRTLTPVKNVTDSVNEISVSNLSKRVSTDNIPVEIEELVTTFNQLLADLEESFSKVTDFTSNASHELKTPLTVIRGEIELALKKERPKDQYISTLKSVLLESTNIEMIIQQLIFLASQDSNEIKNSFAEVYLDEIIFDSIDQIKKIADDNNTKIDISNIFPVSIYANETMLKLTISNILKNAIIYSPKQSVINLSVDEDSQNIFLQIQDYGYGIAEEDLPHVFERFYRADKVRSRKIGGVGLGLSLVKTILELHNYHVEISSKKDKGTTVKIIIPKL